MTTIVESSCTVEWESQIKKGVWLPFPRNFVDEAEAEAYIADFVAKNPDLKRVYWRITQTKTQTISF